MTAKQEQAAYFSDVYARLAAPFDEVFTDTRGGVELSYVTGEQVVSRLNETLGVAGWSFDVPEHGIHTEADEMWVLGRLTANFGGTVVTRQQFGSQKVRRIRASGIPADIGFDLKGATTDALKKCASLIGVGLYLSHKETPTERSGSSAGASNGSGSGTTTNDAGAVVTCAECFEELKETKFRDGTVWTSAQLAAYGRRKHNRELCMLHYREANDARRRQEVASGDVSA